MGRLLQCEQESSNAAVAVAAAAAADSLCIYAGVKTRLCGGGADGAGGASLVHGIV